MAKRFWTGSLHIEYKLFIFLPKVFFQLIDKVTLCQPMFIQLIIDMLPLTFAERMKIALHP